MITPVRVSLQFLRTAAEYAAYIRRQQLFASYIRWKTRLEFPLDRTELGFLAAHRKHPIPASGKGRPRNYDHLDDVEYACLRTSRLSLVAPNMNPGKKRKRYGLDGRPRKHDYANMALYVQSLIQFHGYNKTAAFEVVADAYGVDKSQIAYAWQDSGEAAELHLADVD